MKECLKKFVLSLLIISMITEYYAPFVSSIRVNAQTSDQQPTSSGADSSTEISPGDPGDDGPAIPDPSTAPLLRDLAGLSHMMDNPLGDSTSSDPSSDPLATSFTDMFGSNKAKIILTQSDYRTIRQLYCLSDLLPEGFEDNVQLIAKYSGQSESTLNALKNGSYNDRQKFIDYTAQARTAYGEKENLISRLQEGTDLATAECVTGFDANNLREILKDPKRKTSEYDPLVKDSVNALKLDIRIIKTLVYLVTPKSRGGAGHYRIRVYKIFQSKELSSESDAILENNASSAKSGQTAASVGQSRDTSGTTEDANGNTTGDLYFNFAKSSEKCEEDPVKNKADCDAVHLVKTPDETSDTSAVNRSAHKDGQAVDISEIDDIRCTVVKRYKLRNDKREYLSASPVALAWQTSEGYEKSGGNDSLDMADMLRQDAAEAAKDLIDGLGGDPSEYDGDLSKASMAEIAQVIGKSIMGQILESPADGLSGFNLTSTMEQLGEAYLSDYFGLDRRIFKGRTVNSIDDVYMIVGQASIEARLKLPFGTFSEGTDLKSLLYGVGRRRIEYEMNLDPQDLAGFSNSQDIPLAIGRAVIEKELSLEKGAFTGKDYKQLKANIGPIKSGIISTGPEYIDSLLHVKGGLTKELKSGSKSPDDYARAVGNKRMDDTIYGFQYLSVHDSAYDLPAGTWTGATRGDIYDITRIGIHMLAKAFASDKSDDQKSALELWINNSVGGLLDMPDFYNDKDNIPIPYPDFADNLNLTHDATVTHANFEQLRKYAHIGDDDEYLSALKTGSVFLEGTFAEAADRFNGYVEDARNNFAKEYKTSAYETNYGALRIYANITDSNSALDTMKTQDAKKFRALVSKAQAKYEHAMLSTKFAIPFLDKDGNVSDYNVLYQWMPKGEVAKNDLLSIAGGATLEDGGDVGYLISNITNGDTLKVLLDKFQDNDYLSIRSKIIGDATNNFLSNTQCAVADTVVQEITAKNGNKKQITISEVTAQRAGLLPGDLFRLFGCPSSSGRAIFERIGSKYVYYAIANSLLSDDENARRINLEGNPELKNPNPEVKFYITRGEKVVTLSKEIKKDWDTLKSKIKLDDNDTVNADINFLISILSNPGNIGSTDSAKKLAKQASPRLDRLKNTFNQKKQEYAELEKDFNDLSQEISELIRVCSEILAGEEIPKAQSLDTPTIQNGLTSAKANKQGRSSGKSSIITGAVAMYGFLQGYIKPKDYFIRMAVEKVESALDLPDRSLLYYIQNSEKKGITGMDAFYQAIGQAKIERQFDLPEYYFQGPELKNTLPDFDKIKPATTLADINNNIFHISKDSEELYKTLVKYYEKAGKPGGIYTGESWFALTIYRAHRYPAIKNQSNVPFYYKSAYNDWNTVVRAAKQAYADDLKAQNTHQDNTMADVVNNIKSGNFVLTRPAETDPAFRMGLPGSIDGLSAPGNWSLLPGASSKASQIDRDLGLLQGSTRNLFTGETLRLADGRELLGADEKNGLKGGFNVEGDGYVLDDRGRPTSEKELINVAFSEEVINRYLQLLNGEMDVNGFRSTKGNGVYYNSANPQAQKNSKSNADGTCKVIWTKENGIEVAHDTIEDNAYVYVDKDGKPHSFRTIEQANLYAGQQPSDTQNYLRWTAVFLYYAARFIDKNVVSLPDQYKNMYKSLDSAEDTLSNYLKNRGFDLLPFNEMSLALAAISDDDIIPDTNLKLSTLKKLFGKFEVTGKPLQTYKRAVGVAEAKRVLSATLLRNLGIKIDANLFTAGDIYAILNGDYRPLVRVAFREVDDYLNLPTNTTEALVTYARSPEEVLCTAGDIGAQFLGRLVGLQRVPVSGDISQLYHNFGQSKIEQTLGITLGSFHGDNLSLILANGTSNTSSGKKGGVVQNVGYIPFALAFQIPLSDTPNNDDIRLSIGTQADNVLREMFGDAYVKTNAKQSNKWKLEQIQANLNLLASTETVPSLSQLNSAILIRVLTVKFVTDNDSYFWKDEKLIPEARNFIARLNYLDTVFELSTLDAKSRTLALFTEDITPNAYAERVSSLMGRRIVALDLAKEIGMEKSDAEFAYDSLANWDNIFNCQPTTSHGSIHITDTTCGGRSISTPQGRVSLYKGLAQAFDVNLDNKAKLQPGSIEKIVSDPSQTWTVLADNATRKADEKLHLDPNSNFTITKLYKAYQTDLATNKANEEACVNSPDYQTKKQALDALKAQAAADPIDSEEFVTGIQVQTQQLNETFSNCMKARRGDSNTGGLGAAIQSTTYTVDSATTKLIKNGIQSYLADQIKQKSGVNMPPEDVGKLIWDGDLRYMEVALLSWGANRYLNKDGNEQAQPAAYQLSYSDIVMGIIGDPAVEEAGAVAAQYGGVAPLDANWQQVGMGDTNDQVRPYGAQCLDNNSAADCVIDTASGGLPRTHTAISNNLNNATLAREGVTISLTDARTAVVNRQVELQSHLPRDTNLLADGECQAKIEQYKQDGKYDALDSGVVECMDAYKRQLDRDWLKAADARGRSDARKAMREAFQYRTMDAFLHQMDPAIYPGFSWDMVKGDWQTKLKAIGGYLYNSVKSCKIGGIQICPDGMTSIPDLAQWTRVGELAVNITTGNMGGVNDFLSNKHGEYTFLDDFLTKNSEKWFGFELPKGTIGTLIVGTSTGHWLGAGSGATNFTSEQYDFGFGSVKGTYYNVPGSAIKIPTLTTLGTTTAINWIQKKAFNFADKVLHLPQGTSAQTFGMYMQLRAANRALATLTTGVNSTGGNLYGLKPGSVIKANGHTYTADATGDTFNGGTADTTAVHNDQIADAKNQITQIKVQLISFVITTVLNAAFAKDFANFDDSMNWVPGTTSQLVGLAVYGLTSLLITGAINPVALGIQFAFIMFNQLTGVYRSDVYCTADGFWPEGTKKKIGFFSMIAFPVVGIVVHAFSESFTSYSTNPVDEERLNSADSPTGLKIWDGKNQDVHKHMSIKAAQARANQLIGDLLQMQYNPQFRDVIPNQIMTGRKEDVTYWNQLINDNLCKRMGSDYTAVDGVCYAGDGSVVDNNHRTRAGVWNNAQTTAFTHIGF